MEILLDADGVLADFLSPTLAALNVKLNKSISVEEYVSHQTWHIEQVFGITSEEFWGIIEDGNQLWCNMKPFSWAKELLEYCQTLGRVTICTSPSRNPACASQKTQWFIDHFDMHNGSVMIGGRKELMAKDGNILIDDSPSNVDLFNANGGRGILVPSNWNTFPLTREAVLEAIEAQLNPEDILDEAKRLTSTERNNSYGPPTQDFSRTAKMWSALLDKDIEAKDVALCMIALKMSRLTWNSKKRDSWVDVCGYARCGAVCSEIQTL